MINDHEDVIHHLRQVYENRDALVYEHVLNWVDSLYELTKDQIVVASAEERELLVGQAKAYKAIIRDLKYPGQ